MEKAFQFEMLQAIAQAIAASPEKFSTRLVEQAKQFALARGYWEAKGDNWESASLGAAYIQKHAEEWEGKL